MKYVSTRGKAPELDFEDVMITGLARDGGLYVPKEWPFFSEEMISKMDGCSYEEIAFQVMRPFIGSTFTDLEFKEIINTKEKRFCNEVQKAKIYYKVKIINI